MNLTDLTEHIEHFRYRFLQDVMANATADYWHRRAAAFEAALPRSGDFTGRATPAQVEQQRARVAATVLACRQRAEFMIGGRIQ